MLPGDFSDRYKRQLQLPGFGREAQVRLAEAKVLIVGAGGLGVPVLQYLTAMGVGAIGIVDDDIVSLSNLQRQVLYTTGQVGQSKLQVAVRAMQELNPGVSIRSFNTRLLPANALEVISGYDIVVDATDNFASRYLVNDACVILDKPFVYGAVHQFEGQLSVFNLEGGPTYRCLFPKQPAAAETPDCNDAGVLGVVPGIIGCRQALEVVKVITGVGRNLSGYLQIFDFLNDTQLKIKLKAQPQNRLIKTLEKTYENPRCGVVGDLISPETLQEWYEQERRFILLDLRDPSEFSEGGLPQAQNVPLAVLPVSTDALSRENTLVIYCQKGNRSAKAAEIIRKQIPSAQIFELAGGMDSWIKMKASR